MTLIIDLIDNLALFELQDVEVMQVNFLEIINGLEKAIIF